MIWSRIGQHIANYLRRWTPVPDPTLEAQVRAVAGRVEGVLGLTSATVRKMGFSYYVDLHVIVNGEKSVRDGHYIAHRVEDAVLAAVTASL